MIKNLFINLLFATLAVTVLSSCANKSENVVRIGFIGPLTGNAVDLGVGPSRAMQLAVKQYNQGRNSGQPKVEFFFEDDEWKGENALPLYDKLRSEHGIDILFLSHTDGTIELQEKVREDGVILINSLNNDELLSTTNENTFVIGKKTEEAAQVVAARVVELGKRKVRGFHVTNNFMTISAEAFKGELVRSGVDGKVVPVDITKEDYRTELESFKREGCDALVFFGYKNLGYAMKQARDLGLEVPFFASTTTLGKGYYENSEGAMVGTEFSFFTSSDGNYIIAHQFLESYELEFGSKPFSVWPAMQAFDAMNMTLDIIGNIDNKPRAATLSDWVGEKLHEVKFYQGVCGNIAILDDGTSRGIYFSLYTVKGNGLIEKVKR